MASTSRRSSPRASRPGLGSRSFYSLIVSGIILGAGVCAAMGWIAIELSAARPSGRRIWDGVAEQLVVPICAMVGATFGGLLGLGTAITFDSLARRRERRERAAPDAGGGDNGC